MYGFIAKIGFAFINPKTAAVAWGCVLALCLVGYGVWSWNTIGSLKKDQTALVERNDRLASANKDLVADQADILDRVQAINTQVQNLNTQFGQSLARRQKSYDSLTTPNTPPGEKPDTVEMETRANNGMNELFGELRTLSTPETK